MFDQRYTVFRRDRYIDDSGVGGGVLIAVKSTLNPKHQKRWSSSAEDMWISIPKNSHGSIHICIAYIPPGSDHTSGLSSHFDEVDEIYARHSDDTFIIMGDYNLPHIRWTLDSSTTPIIGEYTAGSANVRFIDFVSLSGLRQYNYVHNISNRILDLVLSNELCEVKESDTPLVPPDLYHKPLSVTVNFPINTLKNMKSNSRDVVMYQKADYVKIRNEISVIDWCHEFASLNTDECVARFHSILLKIINKNVPVKRLKPGRSYPHWFSSTLINVIKEKASFHKKWKKYNNPLDYQTFSLLRARQKQLQNSCHNRYIANIESNLRVNPKCLFSYIKSRKGGGGIPRTVSYNGEQFEEPKLICNSFNDFFASVHVRNTGVQHIACSPSSSCDTIQLNNVEIDNSLVKKYLDSIDVSKGMGSDSIPGIFIKNCSTALSLPLTFIYNRSISDGCFPKLWKKTLITPIYKSGDRAEVSNYRPISKLPIMSKIFEKIIIDQINPLINPYLTNNQHGFRAKRSVDSNLLEFTHSITQSMHNNCQVDAIYTDLAKAFDKINHKILIDKVKMIGIRGNLLRWFESYVCDRFQAVVLHGHVSDYQPIFSGVPQGSHLGPLLFLIYINDMDKCLKHSNILLFADDAKIYREVKNISDCDKLQEDLNHLQLYCQQNQLFINGSKCSSLSYSRNKKKITYNYQVAGTVLKSTHEIKDLGVILDEKLSYTNHIEYVSSRAFRTLGFISRNTKHFRDPSSLTILFNSLVRSVLEFGSTIWNPSYITHINAIERVQNKYIKQLNFRKRLHFASYDQARQYYKMNSLESRRIVLDLCFLHRIINNNVDSPYLLGELPFHCPARRSRYPALFYLERSRTNYHLNSFINRVCTTFNRNSQREPSLDPFSTTLNKFKSVLTALTQL
jgi:hypothetical protein